MTLNNSLPPPVDLPVNSWDSHVHVIDEVCLPSNTADT